MINILVCDDDKNITQQIYNILNKIQKIYNLNFKIDLKHNGDFILNNNTIYDIAILDIEMPEISGLKLSEEIKRLIRMW